MPYKDPERKRQWERDHRQERNALRRAQRINAEKMAINRTPVPDTQGPTSGWKTLTGFIVGVGFVVLAAIGGASMPPSQDGRSGDWDRH
jgi:hypothetical protein